MDSRSSRYPEVEFVTSTAYEPTRKKLKKICATYGVPQTLQTDNGPPFQSHAFAKFAQESGFQDKRITPVHPEAQGQVEGFNEMVTKTITIARHEQTLMKQSTICYKHTEADTTSCDKDDTIPATHEPGCENKARPLSNRDPRDSRV